MRQASCAPPDSAFPPHLRASSAINLSNLSRGLIQAAAATTEPISSFNWPLRLLPGLFRNSLFHPVIASPANRRCNFQLRLILSKLARPATKLRLQPNFASFCPTRDEFSISLESSISQLALRSEFPTSIETFIFPPGGKCLSKSLLGYQLKRE